MLLLEVCTPGGCTWSNAAWCAFVGGAPGAQRGDGWLAAVADDDRERVATLVGRDEPFEVELRVTRADGKARWLLVRGTPRRASGVCAHAVGAMDITEWREAERLLRFLTGLGDLLAGSLEVDEMLQAVARVAVPQLADLCSTAVVKDDGGIRRVAAVHSDPAVEVELKEAGDHLDPEGQSALAAVIRSGATLYRPIVDAPGPDEPWPPLPADLARGPRSLVCAPLRARERVVGAIAIASSSRRYTPDDVSLLQEIAHRCATAVDNSTLYRRSEEARARLALLSSIGEQLAATLDLQQTMRTVVRRVVPVFADVAAVALARPDGSLRRADVCHVDSARERLYRERFLDEPILPDEPTPMARAARLRRPVLVEQYRHEPPDPDPPAAPRPGYIPAAATLGVTSILAVPLVARDNVVGVLTLGFAGSRRSYGAGDLPLALDIARRAALAIERARAFDRERRVAETLQHSLLPDALPDRPGLAFCARYVAGGRLEVGGDWYDVVSLPGDRLGLAIGDVAGHGVRAASVMGQLRHTLRAFATEGYDAAAVVERLNRFVFEQGPVDMATLCYAVLDPARGTLEWALAGHPPPLLVPPDGEPRYADVAVAPPIGVDPSATYRASSTRLAPGTTVWLYTDGLVERRGESLDAGFERLAHHARYAPQLLDDACTDLLARLVGDGQPPDDVAILAFRYAGVRAGPLRLRRPARPAELAPVRRVVGAWLESAGVPAREIGSVMVALNEAATNAIEHAYGSGSGWFEIEAGLSEGALTVAVRDHGRWRTKGSGAGGRGLALIGRLMDEFELRRTPVGTEVWMRRMVPAGHGE